MKKPGRRPAPPPEDGAADRAVALVGAVRGALARARAAGDLVELRSALDAGAAELGQLAALLEEDLDGAATLAVWAAVSPAKGPGVSPEGWLWQQSLAIAAFREAAPAPAPRAFKMPGHGASPQRKRGAPPREPSGPPLPTCTLGASRAGAAGICEVT